jgi:TonB family protein
MENHLTAWRMVDVRGLYAQQIDVARMTLIRGDRPAAAESFRSAIDVARREPGLQRELAPALVDLGKLEQELGRPAEAERLLNEALEIGEREFGAEHPSLGVALNELSRLHIRQSNHARAKTVLERLLRITRTKGADHPDVATALAGLAVVQRGLGDDAAAEQLFRDALRIREKVLAPNHMAVVVTLEQLSETCATRGNFAEALALLQRALPTREAVLGADHATVRAIRSRIAALEVRATTATVTSATSTAAPRSRPNDLVFIYEPESTAPRRVPPQRERMATPTYSAAVAAASLMASPIQMAPPARPAPSAQTAAPASPTNSKPSAPSAQIAAPRRSYDVAPGHVAHEGRQPTIAPLPAKADGRSPRKRTARYASAGLAAVALAIAALTYRSNAGPGSDQVLASTGTEQPPTVATTAMTTNGSTTLGAATIVAAARRDAETRTPESAIPPELPSLPAAPRRLAAMKVPIIATNVDSLVRASTKVGRESYTDQTGMTGGLRTSTTGDDASAKPPVLIGPAPLPYFPDALRSQRTEGEVVVRFRVDERGRVDMSSTKVVRSDHELFTLAVRNVLPRFRFEPARSPAPESKPRSDWVDYRAEFTAKN